MKKTGAWIIIMMILFSSMALADFLLPANLTLIGEEAFMGDSTLTGLVVIPGTVTEIRRDAFTGTNLFALEIPTGMKEVQDQHFNDAVYVRLQSAQTATGAFSGVKYLIAPENSEAKNKAEEQGIKFVSSASVVEQNGLYYQKTDEGLILLSAVDPERLGTTVRVPESIGGTAVTDISSFAFEGCSGVQKVVLPDELLQQWNQTDHSDSPNIEFAAASEEDLLIKSVTANVTSGTVGQSITWTVEPKENQKITSYSYSLQLNGKVIDTKTSASGTYSYSVTKSGSYQLDVEAVNSKGETGKGSSPVLYIAVESMKMTVPETLQNGQDLVVKMHEVPGAICYGVYLTEESTGKSLGYLSRLEPGEVSFKGYLLDKGTYRVTGYVYGNDFRYSVPTVKKLTVTGEKAEGPVIEDQKSIYARNGFAVRHSGAEWQAVSYQFRYNDGSSSEKWIECVDYDLWIQPVRVNLEKWTSGGAILIQKAVLKNGAWTAWGPMAEIEVSPMPKLATPVVNAPETSEAGKDLIVSFESVENATWYYVSLTKSNDSDKTGYEEERSVFSNSWSEGRTIVIPGYDLSAGEYTLGVEVDCENGEYDMSGYTQKIVLTGTRPEAPDVSADKTERYVKGGNVRLTVSAPGAEGAVIKRVMYKDGNRRGGYGSSSISLDEEGSGNFRDDWNYEEEYAGCTLAYQVATVRNGIWSEFKTVEVLLKKQEPLPAPVIEAATTHTAGVDYIFKFGAVENADNYRAYFYQAYSDETICSWWSEEAIPGNELSVPGYYLSQGSYRLVVSARSSERGNSETEILIRVTDSRPTAPTVNVNLDEFHIKDRPLFTVDTVDAEEMMIFFGRTDINLWNREINRIRVTGQKTTWRYTIEEYWLNKDYTFSFSVKKNGVWSSFREITKTILDLPPLDAPVIHVNPTYEAGENIIISFDPVDHAQSYEYKLLQYDYDGGYRNSTEPKTITYLGIYYEPGEYRFRVKANSDEYASTISEAVFQIVGEKQTWKKPIVSQTEIMNGGSLTFEFDTTGVESIEYSIVYYYGSEEDDWDSESGTINVMENTTKWSSEISYGSVDTVGYKFSALLDGRWTAWTDEILIKVLGNDEEIIPPTIELPETHPLGEDLSVTVSSTEAIQTIWAYVYNSNGIQVAEKYLSGSVDGTFTLNGYGLTLGRNRVYVEIDTKNGWSSTEKYFTVVSNSRPQAPEVTPQTEIGRVNVPYTFTVDSDGADKLAVRYYREDNTNDLNYTTAEVTGEKTTWSHRRDTAGQTWKYSFALRVNGVWSPWSKIYSVTISNREQLAGANIHVQETVNAGQDVYVTFDAVENAENYTAYLYKPDGNSVNWNNPSPNAEMRFRGYDLVPGTYRISVTASSADYESSTTEKTFRVVGDRPAAPHVVVSSEEAFTGETFTFTIECTDAEEIAYRRFNNGNTSYSQSGILNVLSDPTIWDTSCSEGDISAGYSFAVLKDGQWSSWSTPKAITIKARPALAEPEVTVPEVIAQGENLTITIGEAENISYYYVYLYDNRGSQIRYRSVEKAGEVTFSGYSLPLGTVRVEVRAYGKNNGSSRTTRYLTVEAGTLPSAPTVTPPDSLTVAERTYFTFLIEKEGAEKGAVRYYRIGSPNDLDYSEFSFSETEPTAWRGYEYNGGNKYAYSFAVLNDGVWSEWSPFTVITIE